MKRLSSLLKYTFELIRKIYHSELVTEFACFEYNLSWTIFKGRWYLQVQDNYYTLYQRDGIKMWITIFLFNQATKECFCGNKLTKTVKKDTEECSSPCKGNRAQGCGGNWRLAVYENTKFPSTAMHYFLLIIIIDIFI